MIFCFYSFATRIHHDDKPYEADSVTDRLLYSIDLLVSFLVVIYVLAEKYNYQSVRKNVSSNSKSSKLTPSLGDHLLEMPKMTAPKQSNSETDMSETQGLLLRLI